MDSSSQNTKPRGRRRFAPGRRQPIGPISNSKAEAEQENENAARRIDKNEEEIHNLVTRTEGDYVEPWGYGNSNPIVLPWRKPNSGDPDLLDLEEFGEVAKHPDYDENTINAAKELGLTPEQEQEQEQHGKNQMLLLKLPVCLPVAEQSTGENTNIPMGKMQIHKSGAVKWKLGDVLFDVSPGLRAQIANDVVAIDTEGKTCVRLGSQAKLAIVTPDVESLLKSDSDKETHK